ncbi:serine-rich adhesin for platelets-like [Dreissena polymorpha]|uniref:Uncharacterized protein n=1 Tax=Dreissena polymorpha TaxID=45954 RepID=A0A9D4I219_DREPO|nr:serine-rich adhesin for platelets-like [Dreissena polymorpha]XP_052239019.1 serine-rich adhesin for platelets-like [Dreissena polymorpha]KAH3741384.1 hypothetical protein DPMN_048109 [Dreissena polymorpha]
MVSEAESTTPVMSSACVDFSQHAWKKDLCVNCQQPRNKHPVDSNAAETNDTGQKTGLSADIGSDSPKPAKRNSIMAKSWTGNLEGENEDDKWNSMCLPDPSQPNKRFSDVDQRLVKPFRDMDGKVQISEHSYEEIHDKKSDEKTNSTASANVSSRKNDTITVDAQKTNISINAEDRLSALVKDNVKMQSNKNLPSRSRSSSRENSPVPGIKPKISDKPFVGEKKTKGDSSNSESSMQNDDNERKKKLNKSRKSISFVTDDPAVIGEDGGLDNLYSDHEDDAPESGTNIKEKIEFSETEKEWALQSLKNTLWNSEHINDESKKKKHTQEFEDLKVESPKKPERSAKEGVVDSHHEGHNFGTFPLRTKSEKTVMDNMFSSNRLSTLSESSESVLTEEDKYESVLRFLGADKLEKLDFNYSPRHKSATGGTEGADYTEASYDDPWCDKFGFGMDSEMNLLDEIKGEIDLDASGAGFALVEMLNDVLAKYGTGPGSETDSVKNFEGLDAEKPGQSADKAAKRDGREMSADFEAKMVHLAENIRKHRAKGRAPRPPSQPPEPPSDAATKSPAKQAELRAAQSKEPTFKMVPLGKVIGTTPLEAQAKADLKAAHGGLRSELSSTSSSNSSDIVDVSKGKADKQAKKSGGIGGFFSRIFGKGKDPDSDVSGSSEGLASNPWTMSDPYIENDGASNHSDTPESEVVPIKGGNQKERKMSNSSPQMKAKIAPNRPISPKPKEMTSENIQKDDISNHSQSQKVSDQSESYSDHNNTKEQTFPIKNESKLKLEPVKQLSPTKDKEPAKATSPKAKEAPPLPTNPPRDLSDHGMVPKPRTRPPPESVAPRSRPRTRELPDGRPRDTPNVPPPKPPVAVKPRPVSTTIKPPEKPERSHTSATGDSNVQANSMMQSQSDAHSSENLLNTEDSQKKADTNVDPKVLRKRAKSPKRIVAPIAPGRASMPNILTHSNTSLASTTSEVSIQSLPAGHGDNKSEGVKSLPFARELEQKLQKEIVATETRKMSVPPPPPTGVKHPSLEKSKSLPVDKQKAGLPDKSKSLPADRKQSVNENSVSSGVAAKDIEQSRRSSKDDPKTSPPNTEDKSKILTNQVSASSSSSSSSTISPSSSSTSTAVSNTSAANTTKSAIADADQMMSANNVPPSTQQGEIILLPEKIELPRPVSNSRKSFLGKLNRNKNKPPAPPSVKRTKSITETSLLGDHHLKKIDLKDISAPVLITDMTSNKVVHRRNTISVGPDDNSFLSGGSTSSGSTSAGDNRDLSPHGSLENMYEFIKTEAPSPPVGDVKRNFYDPVIEGNLVLGLRPPSMTGSEGYLEPVRSHQLHQNSNNETVNKMAESTISLGSMTTSFITTVTNMANANRMTKSTNDVTEDGYSGNHGTDDNLSPERRALLASQPIYEEITNGYGKLGSNNNDERDSKSEDHHSEFYGISDVNQASSLKQKDSFSSDSEQSSANGSLSRPRPIPRRRPRQIGSGFEQYVAMNRPGAAVILNEEQLREMMSKLTSMNLTTIKEIYTQHEKCFTKENLNLGSVGTLKWHDFDIYGKPVHTSEKCVIYNAKLRNTLSPCQVMLLHSRPEITSANHPSLLKPTSIFTDSVPFSYLTDEFIKTSQILETCLNQTNANSSQCYIVVGLFDITESLAHHMNALETVCDNQKGFLAKVLFFVLQLLSAISHCLEQGHSLSEADFHDLYLISNPYCLGETVSFLPQVRASEDQQIDRVCLFLEQFLHDMCTKCDAAAVLDDSAIFIYTGIQKIMEMLESGVIECLPIVRSYTEYLLWGPGENDTEFQDERHSNLEPKLAMWLEKERAELIHDFARRIQHGARCNIRDFYKMKFLCKASSSSLAECIRCHAAAMETST